MQADLPANSDNGDLSDKGKIMLEHKPQSFKDLDEVLYMGDQWLIVEIDGEDCLLTSTSDPRKSVDAKLYDLSHVAVYDELADEFDDD